MKLNDNFWLPIYKTNGITPEIFKGSVLYLGMGTCLFPRLQNELVTKTTIVEIDKKVIDYNKLNDEWIIIQDDAFTFETEEKFDMIFIDIFYQHTTSEILNTLINKYKKMLNLNGEILHLSKIAI